MYRGSAAEYRDAEHGLFLITEEWKWLNRWSDYTYGRKSAPAVPHVDFTDETVILLSLGLRAHYGYSVTIDRVTLQDRTLAVSATEERANDMLDMTCAPVHAVAVRMDRRAFEVVQLSLRIVTIGG